MRSDISAGPNWLSVFSIKAWASVEAWKLSKSSDEILPKAEAPDSSLFGVEQRAWFTAEEDEEEDEDEDDIELMPLDKWASKSVNSSDLV